MLLLHMPVRIKGDLPLNFSTRRIALIGAPASDKNVLLAEHSCVGILLPIIMGPSTKKRKEPPPNRTLLDFFSSPDARKRARVRTSQQPASTRVASREIIVIDDSDGDDSGVPREENGLTNSRLAPRTGVSEDSQSSNSVTSILTHSEDKDGFGVPSALLRPPNSCIKPSSNGFHTLPILPNGPDLSESMIDVSVPLLEHTSISPCFWTFSEESLNLSCTGNQLLERNRTNSAAHRGVSAMVGDNPSNDPAVEFPIGEWAVGDDELVALEVLDCSSGIDGSEKELSDEQRFCPVCGIELTGILVLVSVPNMLCDTGPLMSVVICRLGCADSYQSMSRYNDRTR